MKARSTSFTLMPRPSRIGTTLLITCALVSVAIVVTARLAGNRDFLDGDQPRTMSYIVDTLLHGRWVLPRDMLYEPATKPPFYNWLAVPVVAVAGYREWAFKAPSLAAALAVFLLCLATPRWFAEHDDVVGDGRILGWLAGAIAILNYPTMQAMYLCRPEMLQAALLTAGWVLATLAMRPAQPHRAAMAAAFWACVAGVALTKGPPAFMLLLYPLVFALVVDRRLRAVKRLGWWWGLPLALGVFAGWMLLAYQQAPRHVLEVLVGNEFAGRLLHGNPQGRTPAFWMPAAWFMTKFLPWSLLAAALPLLIGARRMLSPAIAPVVVWLVLIVIFFTLPAGKRVGYLLPAYIPGAILASHALVRLIAQRRAAAPLVAIALLATAAGLATYHLRCAPEAKLGASDRAIAFIKQVRPIVGDAPVLVLVPGKQPIASLLGRHGGDRPAAGDLAEARWVIAPADERFACRVISEPLPQGLGAIADLPRVRLALFDMRAPAGPKGDQLELWQARVDQCAARDFSRQPAWIR